MRPLTAHDIIYIWERGQHKHALDQALLMLSPVLPEMNWDGLANLTVGQRNTCLFALRRETLGPTLRAYAACPECACPLEFSMDTRDICRSERLLPLEQHGALTVEGVEVDFRLLNSRDLAAITGYQDVAEARELLIRRCVVSARDGEQLLKAEELSESVIAALAERVAECDPQAESLLSLDCLACNHQWQMMFDIASFFWSEIASLAKRLLSEVHTLARAYGWREEEILSMSAARRQVYLEMAS
jgi:hypothetical protein